MEKLRYNQHLAEMIKTAMETKGVSMYRLSKKSEVPQSTISRFFAKKTNISAKNFMGLCAALNISISFEFEGRKMTYDFRALEEIQKNSKSQEEIADQFEDYLGENN